MTENNEYALLATSGIITAAQEYTKQMAMQPEAISSVLRTLQAYKSLKALVEAQSALDKEAKLRLIQRSKNEPIGDLLLKSIDGYCQANCFPYNFIAVINQNIYPMAQGLNLKLMADPRIFRSYQLVSKEIVVTDKNYICRTTKRILFANGESYEETGVCDIVQLMARTSDKNPPTPALVEMKAETRAERRCAIKALPLMGMVLEDSSDVSSESSESSVF